MHDTLPNVDLPRGGEWIDVYTTLGIAIGTPLTIKSLSANSAKISIQSASPSSTDGHQLILKGQSLTLDEGSSGIWASSQSGGSINVSPVVAIGVTSDALGRLKTSNDFSLFHGMFTFDAPQSIWLIEEDDVEINNDTSTRATSIDGRLNLTSGAIASNSCYIESRRHPRYQPNKGLLYASSIGFKGANKNGILKAGLFVSDIYGIYFKTKGDGNLYACVSNNSVETHEELIDIPFSINLELGNIYDIQFQWRGVGDIKYFIGNPATGKPELVHNINFLNTLDESLFISDPALNVAYYAENITEEVNLWSGCADVSTEGGKTERGQYGSASTTKTVSAADPIIAIRLPTLVGGKVNTRDVSLARITLQGDKKSSVKAYLTRDATSVVGGSWDTARSGSFVEFNDTITSIDVAKMEEFMSFRFNVGIVDSKNNPDPERIDFTMIHGDYLVLVCDTGANVVTDAIIEYGEEI